MLAEQLERRVREMRLTASGSERLDILRALAALAVMVGHVRGLLFVPLHEVSDRTPFVRFVYLLTALGHQAVMVFFVLSGFLISSHVFDALVRQRWGWRWYLSRRLSRLYVVLIPALLLTLLLDRLGIAFFGHGGVYANSARYEFIAPFDTPAHSGVETLFGNLGFLQEIRVPTFGSNGPLWSLSYEFWYYIAFPLLALTVLLRGRYAARVLALAGVAAVAWFVGYSIRLYFLIWLAGMLAVLAPRFRPVSDRGRLRLIGLAVTLGGLAAALAADRGGSVRGDLLLALPVTVLVYLAVQPRLVQAARAEEERASRLAKAWKTLAGFSFTLYVVHFPLLVFLRAFLDWTGTGLWQPDLAHLSLAAVVALAVLGCAYALSLVTEARTTVVRNYVTGWVARGTTAVRER